MRRWPYREGTVQSGILLTRHVIIPIADAFDGTLEHLGASKKHGYSPSFLATLYEDAI